MHYYKRNLGDYAKKAGRLTMLQHGAYTLLTDACYDRERFPTLDEAIDWTWASTEAEIEAVKFVLRKFFTLEAGVYVQKRIQEEVGEYHTKSTTNARIAKEREAKRKESSTERTRNVNDSSPGDNEPPPNQEPITINHKEEKEKEKKEKTDKPKRTTPVTRPEDVAEQTWTDWLALRKAKNAPVTETVLKSAIGEAQKANLSLNRFLEIWCARGSQGLEASWLKDSERQRPANTNRFAGAAAALFEDAPHV
jgi:uncharacterized protein YdaU (DUF1376 family)